MGYENDTLEEEDFRKEITELKICLVEKEIVIDTLTHHLIEKDKHNEKLECEVVSLRK